MSPQRRKGKLLPFAILSLVLHLNFFLALYAVTTIWPDALKREPPPLTNAVDISLVPSNAIARQESQQLQQEAERLEQKELEEERQMRGQVVDIPRPREEKRPKDSRFLSEYDSTVAKETKARPRPVGPGDLAMVQPTPTPPKPVAPRPPEPKGGVEKRVKLAMRTPAPQRSLRELTEDGIGPPPRPPEPPSAPGRDQTDTAGTGPEGKLPSLNELQLTPEQLGRVGGSRANDALSDVEEGNETALNSTRWRYASFFNRVKRQVAENWHPDRVYQRRDPSGNVYGFTDRFTVLRVTLTPEGKLESLTLERGSGVGFLDDEAMSAFRLAEPFPNPPKGLVDEKTGLISFRFGFVFEISRGASFRIFRSLN